MRIMVLLLLLPLYGCVATTAVMKNDAVTFPESRSVEILDQKPDEPFVVIATLETRGGTGTSLPSILESMRKKAKEIGADAIIPTKDVSEYKAPGILYNPWLGGYQTLPGGKMPAIQGLAIVYERTVRQLKSGGYNFYQPRRSLFGGFAVNAGPLFFNGIGAGAWVGKDKLRFVGEFFTFDIPNAFYTDEFENGTVDSGFRIGVDYFFLGSLKGIYFPVGFESWRYSIGVKETEVRGKYDMAYLSAGIGYLYPFNKNIYFDSKFSLNASLSNKTEVEIDDRVLFPDKAAYNLFLGVGVKF